MTRTELLTRLTFPEKMEQDVITNLDVQFHSDLSYTTVAFMLPEKNAVAEKMSRNQTADQTLDQTTEPNQSLVKNQGVNNCVSCDNSSVCNESVNHQTRNQTWNQTEKKQVLQKILSIITENPKISRREIARLLNVTDSSAQKLLARLIKSGIIRRVGTNRKGAWLVIKDFE